MIKHIDISDAELRKQIREKHIRWGGNRMLKIYGRIGCQSGKRMKRENRVFFTTENEAISNGFRPCGHCMKMEYRKWKMGV